MLEHAGACLHELIRSRSGAAPETDPAIRKAEVVELVRRKRDEGRQDIAFGARPFILCGLPIRRLPPGVLKYTRRNGRFFLEIVGHPDYGVPFGQDRLIPIWVATQVVRFQSRTVEFDGAGQILSDLGLPQKRGPLPPTGRRLPARLRKHDILWHGREKGSRGGLGLQPRPLL